MPKLELDSPIQYLKGVGPKMAEKLKRLEIETPFDLLYHLPRYYIDYSRPQPIGSARIGEQVVIKGKIIGLTSIRTARKRMAIIEFLVADGSGQLKIIYFNQPFLKTVFREGEEFYFYGKVSYDFQGRMKTLASPSYLRTPQIIPVYPETAGVNSKYLNRLSVISLQLSGKIPEFLPEEVIKASHLISPAEALKKIHQPKSMADTDLARRRLAFEELYLTALQTQLYRQELKTKKAPAIKISDEELKKFVKTLPFELTAAQKKSAWQIVCDLRGRKIKSQKSKVKMTTQNSKIENERQETTAPMNRLLNGDVGSGKTVVAAMAIYACVKSGYQAVLMAPTEILAFQHYETLKETLKPFGIRIGLATSSRKELSFPVLSSSDLIRGSRNSDRPLDSRLRGNDKKESGNDKNNNETTVSFVASERSEMKQWGNGSQADLLIGTHALLGDKIPFHNTALVIVDEQHRFGVKQRNKLLAKAKSGLKSSVAKSFVIASQRRGNPSTSLRTGLSEYKIAEPVPRYRGILTPRNDKRGDTNYLQPHFLSMTATPIPRTLQLTLYGDLDVSIIDEMPKGRKPVMTEVVADREREQAYTQIRQEIKKGRQAFIICPLIEDSTQSAAGSVQTKTANSELPTANLNLFEADRKAVVAEHKKLKESVFPEIEIGLLHGKMKPKEKSAAMSEFTSGKAKILVSTSVVEVGVDVPNATVMMIEDAERFGLAQLHQFRGRVGRSQHQAQCFLMTRSLVPESIQRLKALEEFHSGFKLAEIDLEFRGPGEVYGREQSGFGSLRLELVSDIFLLEEARENARETLRLYPDISALLELKKRLDKKFAEFHRE